MGVGVVPVSLRERLGAGGPAIGLWAAIPTPLTAEAAALAGPDYVVADQQHGALEPTTLMTMLQAGETMVIDPGGDPGDDTRLLRHVGRGTFVLADGKGVVSLRTTDDLVTDCEDWGAASCR